MSPLARKLYTQLRKRVVAGQQSITYAALAKASGNVHPRSPALHAALGEVTNACRHTGLPVLPAIVWKAGSNRPSTGYYKVAHPRAHTDEARLAAWEKEHAKVIAEPAVFPQTLELPAELQPRDQAVRTTHPRRANRCVTMPRQ